MLDRQHPLVIRNSRVVVGLYWLIGLCSFVIAACAATMTIYEWFLVTHHTFLSILGGAQWAFAAWCFWLMGAQMWKIGSKTNFSRARLDEQGINFRLGTKKKPNTLVMSWDEILAVMHRRLPGNQYYAVVAKDERKIEFTLFTFFRAKKLARLIAEHVGQTVHNF